MRQFTVFIGIQRDEDRVGREEAVPEFADAMTTVTDDVSLEVQLRDGAVVLSWIKSEASFDLQTTDNLSSPIDWRSVELPPTDAGDRWMLSIEPAENLRFFRLARP